MSAEERYHSLEPDGWELESAVARHERSPDTFEIPEEDRRGNVRIGQAAKLLFQIRPDGPGDEPAVCERMWVVVTAREGEEYVGRLQNQPRSRAALSPGTMVRFRPEHIADIDTPPADYEMR